MTPAPNGETQLQGKERELADAKELVKTLTQTISLLREQLAQQGKQMEQQAKDMKEMKDLLKASQGKDNGKGGQAAPPGGKGKDKDKDKGTTRPAS